MCIKKSLVNIVTGIVLLFVSIGVASAEWTVSRKAGDVWIGGRSFVKVALTNGQQVPEDSVVRTGRNGRVVLTRGAELIAMGPNSQIKVGSERRSTEITQKTGSIVYEVDKRRGQRFSVTTPHLVAVVKGTRFIVSVDREYSFVGVNRGLVGVRDKDSGRSIDVGPKRSATVAASGRPNMRRITKKVKTIQVDLDTEIAAYEKSSNGNAGSNGKSNAGGNGKNSAGGSGNGKSNNASGNGNVGGNGNGNGNAGGNGNGNGNAGGNGNGNGSSGGNGKGKDD